MHILGSHGFRVYTRSFVSLSAEFARCLLVLYSLHNTFHHQKGAAVPVCTRAWSVHIHVTRRCQARSHRHGDGTAALGEISPNSFWPSAITKQTLKCHWPLEGHPGQAGSRVKMLKWSFIPVIKAPSSEVEWLQRLKQCLQQGNNANFNDKIPTHVISGHMISGPLNCIRAASN